MIVVYVVVVLIMIIMIIMKIIEGHKSKFHILGGKTTVIEDKDSKREGGKEGWREGGREKY